MQLYKCLGGSSFVIVCLLSLSITVALCNSVRFSNADGLNLNLNLLQRTLLLHRWITLLEMMTIAIAVAIAITRIGLIELAHIITAKEVTKEDNTDGINHTIIITTIIIITITTHAITIRDPNHPKSRTQTAKAGAMPYIPTCLPQGQ